MSKWEPIEEAMLRQAWVDNVPMPVIASKLTRSPRACYTKARDMGLPNKTTGEACKPRNKVSEYRRNTPAAARELWRTQMESRPDYTPNRDDEYVALCKVHGGFWAFTEDLTTRAGCRHPLVPPFRGRAA